MSETTTETTTSTVPAPVALETPSPSVDNWKQPQSIIALYTLLLTTIVVILVFWRSSTDIQNIIATLVAGTGLQSVLGFYFGSSRSSQVKDEKIPPITTTTVTQK